jgi:cell division transport system ATP-binding protein
VIEAAQSPFIQFDNVQVQYGKIVYGVRDVSLCVEKGEFAFFVGKTGAGKSTLLKLLTREVRDYTGSVKLAGRELNTYKDRHIAGLRRTMGIVPQDFALLPRKRVWDNLAYAMQAVGHSKKEVRKRVPEILELVKVGHRADAFPHELSGGEQQRVAIGRALINKPPLLLADEPTGNLDPEISWEIMELLLDLNKLGTTILVASHDMMVIHRMGKRIITIDQGTVLNDSVIGGELFAGQA